MKRLLIFLIFAGMTMICGVTRAQSCQAYFAYGPMPADPYIIQFENLSTGSYTALYWAFGDGTSSSEPDPSHAYNSSGIYPVCLTISDSIGLCSSVFCDSVIVNDITCNADFTYQPTGNIPFEIKFMDLSTGNIEFWYWDFGDSTFSTEINPVHTYAAAGNYSVCLLITSQDPVNPCSDVLCQEVAVGISSQCIAGFEAVLDSISSIPNLYHFQNTSTGNLNSWFWNFGDGTSSSEKEPSHEFAEKGTYEVCLSAYDSLSPQFCNDQVCQIITTPDYLYFGGQLFAGGFPINNPSNTGDTGVAYLYKVFADAVIPLDTNVFTNNMGLYVFNDLLPGNYLIKAGLTENSEHAGEYFPTYYSDVINWTSSAMLELHDTIYDANISMKAVPLQTFSGTGTISGIITAYDDLNDENYIQDRQVEVLLYSENYEPLTYTISDASGHFVFNQLDYGSYFLNADLTGWGAEFIPVTLNEFNPSSESVNIILNVFSGLGIDENPYEEILDLSVYPNPFKEILNVDLTMEKPGEVILEVHDIFGRCLIRNSYTIKAGQTTLRIPAEHLNSGVYLVSACTSNGIHSVVNKVVH